MVENFKASFIDGPIDGVVVEKLKRHYDKRGELTEVFRLEPHLHMPMMGYTSITKGHVVRGPHEHARQQDMFVFPAGVNCCIWLWDNREKSDTFGNRMLIRTNCNMDFRIVVPPGVVHAYKNESKADAFTMNFPNRLYRGGSGVEDVDEIRWEDDPDSPFELF